MNDIAIRLVYLMEKMDMKQTELAEAIGISKQSLYKYLHCKCEPRAEIIARMANTLNTSADYIVGITCDPSPIKRNKSVEQNAKKEQELLSKFKQLSFEDQIRIEERMDILLEKKLPPELRIAAAMPRVSTSKIILENINEDK